MVSDHSTPQIDAENEVHISDFLTSEWDRRSAGYMSKFLMDLNFNKTHAELVRPYFRYVCDTCEDINMTSFYRENSNLYIILLAGTAYVCNGQHCR